MKHLLHKITADHGDINKNTNNNNIHKKLGPLHGKYEVGKLIGRGSFANVYQARNMATGEGVAIKAVNKSRIIRSGHTDNIKREISVLRRVRHPNVICLREVLATKGKIFFVMDFARGGELLSHVKRGGRFGESLCRRYFRQLISAVGHCHRLGVFHRDIKPENLLLDSDWNLRVSDFGLSAFVKGVGAKNKVLQTVCGTPAYIAPEILLRNGYGGAAADVWSCGVVLFVMAAGYLPFDDVNMISMYRKINKGEFQFPKWLSPELRHLISRMLDTNPKTRITIEEISDDVWFTDGSDSEQDRQQQNQNEDEVSVISKPKVGRCVNAFDLIAHSASLDLSGLFINSGAEQIVATVEWEDEYKFMSGQDADIMLQMVKKVIEERCSSGDTGPFVAQL